MFPDVTLFNIARELLKGYKLDAKGIHGVNHWGRVLLNGTELAEEYGANIKVVQLFALFHDSRRENDHIDPDHGARGAALAGEMNGGLFRLEPGELALLQDACARHTQGLTEADITVQACWDADRLDLPRVRIFPVPEKLCTPRAREREYRALTDERSIFDLVTPLAGALRRL